MMSVAEWMEKLFDEQDDMNQNDYIRLSNLLSTYHRAHRAVDDEFLNDYNGVMSAENVSRVRESNIPLTTEQKLAQDAKEAYDKIRAYDSLSEQARANIDLAPLRNYAHEYLSRQTLMEHKQASPIFHTIKNSLFNIASDNGLRIVSSGVGGVSTGIAATVLQWPSPSSGFNNTEKFGDFLAGGAVGAAGGFLAPALTAGIPAIGLHYGIKMYENLASYTSKKHNKLLNEKAHLYSKEKHEADKKRDRELAQKYMAENFPVVTTMNPIAATHAQHQPLNEIELADRQQNTDTVIDIDGSYKKGGVIPKTGVYQLHKGERVLKA